LSSLQEEEEEEEDKLRFRSVRMMFYDVLLCRISEAYILSGQGENPATETYHVFTSKELAGPMAHRLPNKAHNQKRRGAS
jgi:hypothetical protein